MPITSSLQNTLKVPGAADGCCELLHKLALGCPGWPEKEHVLACAESEQSALDRFFSFQEAFRQGFLEPVDFFDSFHMHSFPRPARAKAAAGKTAALLPPGGREVFGANKNRSLLENGKVYAMVFFLP